jgi:hypothetical protein
LAASFFFKRFHGIDHVDHLISIFLAGNIEGFWPSLIFSATARMRPNPHPPKIIPQPKSATIAARKYV